MVICLERGADLHMAQLMPLPLTVSCFSKIQTGFTFLVPADPGRPGQRTVKRVCVFVCVLSWCCLCVHSAGHGCAEAVDSTSQSAGLCEPWLDTTGLPSDTRPGSGPSPGRHYR